MNLFYLFFNFHFLLGSVFCSAGDRSSEFRSCTQRCEALTCRNLADVDKKLPLALKLTWWTCLEDCQYQCMHEVTALDISLNRPVRQFFGKVKLLEYSGISLFWSPVRIRGGGLISGVQLR